MDTFTTGTVFLNFTIAKDRNITLSTATGKFAGGILHRGWWTTVNS